MRFSTQPLRRRPHALLAALLFLLSLAPVRGAEPPPAREKKPRLVVVVVIDMFPPDFLERFRSRFGPDGFNRLLREGASFTSCFYPYANTETGPSHATLSTGTTPDRHGIAANGWYDFARGRAVQAVEDESAPVVGGASRLAGASPRNLMASTLADELHLATGGEAKVFGVALKDRSAVFSTGHTASGAYWYNIQTGTFVTSRYYREALPAWVESFNRERGADSYYGKTWKSGEKVLATLASQSGRPDASFRQELYYSPYGNDLVFDFARELVVEEKLGADPVTDFLFLGLSANDGVGHRWGPYSEEVADMTRRTDAQLAALLQFLDKQVGAGNYWLALSADHGVAPTLEQARARGLPAKNVPLTALTQALQAAFAARWGEDDWLASRSEVVFNRETLRKHGVGVSEAAHLAGGALLGVDGVLGYVAGEETRLDPGLTQAVRLSTYRGRSPDVYVVFEPFALVNGEEGGTTHGSPYNYDTHVPLIFYGAAFRAGTYRERVTPADLAPTLAAALGLTPPALADGRILESALRPAAPARRRAPAEAKPR